MGQRHSRPIFVAKEDYTPLQYQSEDNERKFPLLTIKVIDF